MAMTDFALAYVRAAASSALRGNPHSPSISGQVVARTMISNASRLRQCGFRGIGAVISRDRGRLFHGIAGSHFAVAGRLVDGFMESGLMAEVKGFRVFAAHAFA